MGVNQRRSIRDKVPSKGVNYGSKLGVLPEGDMAQIRPTHGSKIRVSHGSNKWEYPIRVEPNLPPVPYGIGAIRPDTLNVFYQHSASHISRKLYAMTVRNRMQVSTVLN